MSASSPLASPCSLSPPATSATIPTTSNPDTGTAHSADTIVTKREMQDTAVVNYDTTVSTDTVHKKGTKPVDTDTVHN